MTADTLYGVRLREPTEMRRLALIVGFLWLVFSLTNGMLEATIRGLIAHPNAHLAVGIVGDVGAIAILMFGLGANESTLGRWWPIGAIVLLMASVILLPLAMILQGYPTSTLGVIGYPITATLAFYVFDRRLATVAAALIVVCHGIVEVSSDAPWPPWPPLLFVAVSVVAAGYFMGNLMSKLEEARDAEHEAATELADLNANLEAKVAEQVGEVERFGRLRRFLSAPVAEAVLTSSDESRLAPHRREIAVLFCDLRGFTAFTKQVEPEEVMEVLDAYYAAAGAQITKFQATLGSFEGDGLMAYLNDPVPCDEPARRVVEMGLAIADAVDALTPTWHRRGYDLSYGIGMAFGHATLGVVGFDGRNDYTAMGTVVNLGARLCNDAKARELVVDHRVYLQAEDAFAFTEREPVRLKGFNELVPSYLVQRVDDDSG